VVRVAALCLIFLSACAPPPADPNYPQGGGGTDDTSTGGGVGGGIGVASPVNPATVPPPAIDPGAFGTVDQSTGDFSFEGGRIDFELRREGDRVLQIARNRYAVPIVVAYTLDNLENAAPVTATTGVVVLPAAPAPLGKGAARVLAELQIQDRTQPYRRTLGFHARFGDPRARPNPYPYRLPYQRGLAFAVLQGFHGTFSHRGSNEYAVDFNCPVATKVLAARAGVVVAANASAQGSGTSAEFLEYTHVNFVLVQHEDGTLGEYMHLAPSGVLVQPGQRVARGQALALSGNTGFSSTPHLHFQVMTAADDGVAAQPFPFQFAIGANRVVEPVQGETYVGWE